MAWSFDVNNVAGGCGNVIYDLKELLKAAGWTVMMSGGGTGSGKYSATSDYPLDATDCARTLAWFVIRQPAASGHPTREFLFQRNTSSDGGYGQGYDIWVSTVAHSSSGCDEDTKPALTSDERQIAGVATNTHGTPLFPVAGTYKYHLGCDGAAPWGWYALWSANGGAGTPYGMVFDPLSTGSFASADADPAVYNFTGDSVYGGPFTFAALCGTGNETVKYWLRKGLQGETFCAYYYLGLQIPGMALYYDVGAYGQAIPNYIGANPYSSKREHFPIPWGRCYWAYPGHGWKGIGSVQRWMGPDLANFDTLSESAVRKYIVVGDVCVPWPDVAPVL